MAAQGPRLTVPLTPCLVSISCFLQPQPRHQPGGFIPVTKVSYDGWPDLISYYITAALFFDLINTCTAVTVIGGPCAASDEVQALC